MGASVSRKWALAIALVLLLALTTSAFLYLFYPQLIYDLDSVSNLGNRYSVRTYRKIEGGKAYCEVLFGLRRVYSCSGRRAFFVELLGPDVTSSGKPNLVLRQWHGSAHGDSSYRVLELDGPKVREIAVIGGLVDVEWQDVNGDGRAEVTGRDRAYSYFMGGDYAGSPRPAVVLSYDKTQGGFRLDKEAMSRRPLSESELTELGVKYKQDARWRAESRPPAELADTMLELIYSGNSQQAWQLMEESWPDGAAESKLDFRRTLENDLIHSPFYSAITAWNDEKS